MGHLVGFHGLFTRKQFWVTMLEIVKVEMPPTKHNGASSMHVPVATRTCSPDFGICSALSLSRRFSPNRLPLPTVQQATMTMLSGS